MKMYKYEEARDLSSVLNVATLEDVIVTNEEGAHFRISALHENNTGKSPFEGITGIKANVTTEELVEIIRESRAGV